MIVRGRQWVATGLVVMVGLLVVGCAAPAADPQPLRSAWFQQWLQGIPCRAPCWHGITPGVTTGPEAGAILRHLPFVTNVEVETDSVRGLILWDTQDIPESRLGGSIQYEPTGRQLVTVIAFSPSGVLHLGDLLATYGPPSHILASDHFHSGIHGDDPPMSEVRLVFLPQGILVREYDKPPIPRIDADFPLDTRVRLFVPNAAGLDSVNEPIAAYTAWSGFQDFQFYLCKQRTPDYIPRGC